MRVPSSYKLRGAGAPATATTTTGATKKTLGNHNRIKSNKMRENSAFAKGNNNYTFINRHALETLYQLKVNAKKERGRERDSAQFHQLAHNFLFVYFPAAGLFSCLLLLQRIDVIVARFCNSPKIYTHVHTYV